jgi:hypothetical protein
VVLAEYADCVWGYFGVIFGIRKGTGSGHVRTYQRHSRLHSISIGQSSEENRHLQMERTDAPLQAQRI